ncbi:uncharacterized protein LOC119681860 [Teleopsis dalmanni]|uniref:uncharacterized protein LOC119681860 n=1 Tax=Teleopsis dalmanni TaxID=139649 RepID=UPI0018CD3625|nr:uncharacterized protein LOC119681860 [Teleopsis dalmanni]
MRHFKEAPEMTLNSLENLNEGVYYTKKYNKWMNQLCEKKLSMDDIAKVLEFERSLQQNASEKNVPLNTEATDFYVDRFIDILAERRNQINIAEHRKRNIMIRRPRKPGFKRKAIKKITTNNNAKNPNPLPVIKPKRQKAKRKYRKKKNGPNKAIIQNPIIPKEEVREKKQIKKKPKQPKKRKPIQRKKPAKQRKAIKKIMPMIYCPLLPKDNNHSLTDLIHYVKSTPKGKKPNKKNKRKVVNKMQKQRQQENKVKAIGNKRGKKELNNFFQAKNKPANPKGIYQKKKRNAKKNKRNIYKKKKNGFDRKKIQKIFTNQDKCSLSTQPSIMSTENDSFSDVKMMDWHMDSEDFDYTPYRTPQNKKKKCRPAKKRVMKKKQK